MTRTDQSRPDPELLGSARLDPAAFEEFYDRYSLMIGYWIRRRTGNPDLAADLTAETFARAWLSLRKFKGTDPDSGAPWLFGIAGNLVGTYFRKQKVEAKARRRLGIQISADTTDEFERVDDRLRAEAARPQMCSAVAALPDDQRAALELRTIEQLPYEQVASRLGCSENAARLRVSRALGELRAGLEAQV